MTSTGGKYPARTLAEAWAACDPFEVLFPRDPRWVDFRPFWQVRPKDELRRALEMHWAANRYAFLAFVGHRGSGKSTEMVALKEELPDALVLRWDVTEEVNPYDLEYSDLFLLIARELERAAREQLGTALPGALLEDITRWLASVTNLGEPAPFDEFFANLTSILSTDSPHKETLRFELQKYPRALIDNTNALLTAVRTILGPGRPIVLIFDKTDRYLPQFVDRAVLRPSDVLRARECDKIFVLHSSLLYDPPGPSLVEIFDAVPTVLPMVPIFQRDLRERSQPAPAFDAMLGALARRVDFASIFAHPQEARTLVHASGGSIQQLMLLCRQAFLHPGDSVDAIAVEAALHAYRDARAREIFIDAYPLLAQVRLTRRIANDAMHRNMLYRQWVFEYDGGERWYDVNPLIEQIEDFRRALAGQVGGA